MVLKCTFSSSDGKKEALADCLRNLAPLSRQVKKKGVYPANRDKEGRISIIILYEFEELRLMEVFREIFKQIDSFSGVPGFNFSAEIYKDCNQALKSMDEVKYQDGGESGHGDGMMDKDTIGGIERRG